MQKKKLRHPRIWKGVFLGGLLVFLLLSVYIGSGDQNLANIERWMEAHRGLSFGLLILAYVIMALVAGPVLPIQLAAGFLFGALWGFILVMGGTLAGSSSSFLVGRYLAKDFVQHYFRDSPRFRAFDEAIARRGFQVILLLRLNPILPYGLQNYFFSVTPVRLRQFLTATMLGSIPWTLLCVYAGALGRDVVGHTQYPTLHWVLIAGGFIASLVAFWIVVRSTRNVMRQAGGWDRHAVRTEARIRQSLSSTIIRKLDL